MKYIITENRLNQSALNYLNLEFKNAREELVNTGVDVYGQDNKLLFDILEMNDGIYKLRISRRLIERVTKMFTGVFNGHQIVELIEKYIKLNYPDYNIRKVMIKTTGI